MASRHHARRAKAQLGEQLAGHAWLRGVGLEGSGDEYRVRVNVKELTPEVRAQIPEAVDGVEVAVAAVGDIAAHGDREK